MPNIKILNRKNFIIFFFTLLILNYLFFNYRILLRENGYILGDWVINYSAGFVKRALLGHLFYSFSIYSNISIINIVFIFSSIIYITSIYWFYLIIKDRLDNDLIFIFILLPSTFLFSFFDPLTVGRKEVLVFFFFTFYYLNLNKIDLFLRYKLIAFILFIIIILTHELIFFFIPFLFILRFLHNKNAVKFKFGSYLLEFLILFFGTLIFFIIIKINHLHDNELLCSSLLNVNLTKNTCWAINDFKNQIKLTILYSYFLEKNYFQNYLLYFIISTLPLFFLIYQSQNQKKIEFISFYVISLLFSLSFFVQVNDWGRYLNVIFLVLFLVTLLFTKNDKNLSFLKNKKLYLIKIFVVFFFLTTWHMPHCCNPQLGKGYFNIYERIVFRINDNSFESTKYKDLPRIFLRKLLKID